MSPAPAWSELHGHSAYSFMDGASPPAARALLAGDPGRAGAALDRLRAIFGAAHTWVELQRGGLPDDHRLCYDLARRARRAGVPLVATGNTHYAEAADRDLQDVLVCL